MSKESEYVKLLADEDVRAWHDNLSQGSPITADVYLRRLGSFCGRNSITPKSLTKINPKRIQNLLITLVSDMKKGGNAGSYIHSNIKAVKSWLAFNEIEIKNKIKIEGSQDAPTLKEERVPTQQELRAILLAADLQQRVSCVLLAHSGLRPESLGDYYGKDGLKVSDFPEMEIHPRKQELVFSKIPTLLRVRNNLSKARHEYFTFLTGEGCQYLKEYLEQRMRSNEDLKHDSPILTPKKDSHTKKALGSHITSTNVGDMIRTAIRKAGFSWRPYVLRAYFDSQTLIAENNGKIAKDYRAFFMGHKGDIEARYTTNKGKLTQDMIEDMRSAFKKASSFLGTMQVESKDASELKRLFLLAAHVPEEEVRLKNLTDMGYDELGKFLRERLDKLVENGRRQLVVPVDEVKNYISKGYDFQANLGNGEAILKMIV